MRGLLNRSWIVSFVIVVSFNGATLAQEEDLDSLMNYYLRSDSILLDELERLTSDSLSILDLIDSLLSYDIRFSQISTRFGYTSRILNAGRDLGINQYGFNGALSYYHKSGLLGEVSGFWNSDISPNFNPLITTVGYLGSIKSKFSYILSYDHFFYSQQSTTDEQTIIYSFNNSLNASAYYDLKYITPGVDYSYMFGEETAHRIGTYLTGNIRFRKLGFGAISILPTASLLFGNQTIYYQNINFESLRIANRIAQRRGLTLDDFDQWRQYVFEEGQENVFGLMNVGFSLPIYVHLKKLTFLFNYHFNIPQQLPGETIDVSPNSYFNLAIFYSHPFK